jgi:hypothetical protein
MRIAVIAVWIFLLTENLHKIAKAISVLRKFKGCCFSVSSSRILWLTKCEGSLGVGIQKIITSGAAWIRNEPIFKKLVRVMRNCKQIRCDSRCGYGKTHWGLGIAAASSKFPSSVTTAFGGCEGRSASDRLGEIVWGSSVAAAGCIQSNQQTQFVSLWFSLNSRHKRNSYTY